MAEKAREIRCPGASTRYGAYGAVLETANREGPSLFSTPYRTHMSISGAGLLVLLLETFAHGLFCFFFFHLFGEVGILCFVKLVCPLSVHMGLQLAAVERSQRAMSCKDERNTAGWRSDTTSIHIERKCQCNLSVHARPMLSRPHTTIKVRTYTGISTSMMGSGARIHRSRNNQFRWRGPPSPAQLGGPPGHCGESGHIEFRDPNFQLNDQPAAAQPLDGSNRPLVKPPL